MNKATDILSEEHKHILKLADVIEKECGNIEKKGEIRADFWPKAVEFIKKYADQFHHAKEENILFKEFEKNNTGLVCNPVEQMLYEHDLGRNYVKGMIEGLEKGESWQIKENALGYAQLIREHIFKEDNILYPMVNQVLPEDSQKIILEQFQKVEQEKFKPHEEKRLLTILEQL